MWVVYSISNADLTWAGSICLFLKIDGVDYALTCQHVCRGFVTRGIYTSKCSNYVEMDSGDTGPTPKVVTEVTKLVKEYTQHWVDTRVAEGTLRNFASSITTKTLQNTRDLVKHLVLTATGGR